MKKQKSNQLYLDREPNRLQGYGTRPYCLTENVVGEKSFVRAESAEKGPFEGVV